MDSKINQNFSARIGLLFLSIFMTQIVSSQNNEKAIKAIRKEFKAINSIANYEIIELENDEVSESFPDHGISLKGYFDDGNLRKIMLWVGYNHKRTISEYYLKDSKLFFMYEVEELYYYDVIEDQMNYDSIAHKNERRYYIAEDRLIETKFKGEIPEKNETAETLMTVAKNYTEKLVAARKTKR
ncbi:MAG: hypothetical protein ACPG21_01430 [Crocinitomicaceae bacterium]